MTTSQTARLTKAILELDYGDEQERLRYYEAYALMVHLHLIVLPVVAAAAIAVIGADAVAASLAILAAYLVCTLVGKLHLERHQVRLELIALSGRNRTYLVLYGIAWVLLLVTVAAAGVGDSSFGSGFAIGATAGIVAGVVALAVRANRQRRAESDSIGDIDDGNRPGS